MNPPQLAELQSIIQGKQGVATLEDYFAVATNFLSLIEQLQLTRIVSPTSHHYIFYQYGAENGFAITRPLNSNLFLEVPAEFRTAVLRFIKFLGDVKQLQGDITELEGTQAYLDGLEIHKVIYTTQQALGCIADSLAETNQARKRVGQLFESFITLILQAVGVECESRTIKLPIPDYPGYQMPYELDVVFSRNKAIITTPSQFIYSNEVVGSVKTTSKDRLDKIFLDKFLLTKLLQREIPVVAIFLHDVQRARKGNSIFGVNSTFKSNHFLGYTVAFTELDGVYYIDPRPEMSSNPKLHEQIRYFQQFLVRDLWDLTNLSHE